MTLTSKQRKQLRGLAHDLRPLIQIGQKGLTDGLFDAINEALETHELIKIKFLDCKDEKHEISAEIENKLAAGLCGIIGNIAIFYRESSDLKKRRINISNIGERDN